MERILALVSHEGLCWKCLQTYSCLNINVIKIHELGYGSQFDGESTEIHLCEKCYKESIKDNPELWNMETKEYDKYNDVYLYEGEMINYINQIPIQGRQFVKNEFSSAAWQMEPQDWIDFELDILSSDKRKEYGFESPDDIEEGSKAFEYMEYIVFKTRAEELEKKFESIR